MLVLRPCFTKCLRAVLFHKTVLCFWLNRKIDSWYVTQNIAYANVSVSNFWKGNIWPIRTSKKNRNCPWQKPSKKFCSENFSSVASALTWVKSSNCVNTVVEWQLASLKNYSILNVSPCNMRIAKVVVLPKGGRSNALQNLAVYIKDSLG